VADLLEKAITAKRESRLIEFKSAFNTASTEDWCEIIKDIAALANTAGGAIVFGVDNTGVPCGFDPQPLLTVDLAQISDKIFRYTSTNFSDLELVRAEKSGSELAVLLVSPVDIPLVFTSPGTYAQPDGKQKSAFSRGTVYFRHGAKSEPVHRDDLRLVVERNLESARRSWLDGINKVTRAPHGSIVHVLPPHVRPSMSPDASPIHLVDDPSAPAWYRLSPDETHPYRQKDVISLVNQRLPESSRINQFHIRVIRAVHRIDENGLFAYHPKYSSQQYSQAFVEWLVEQFTEVPEFFGKARQAYDANQA